MRREIHPQDLARNPQPAAAGFCCPLQRNRQGRRDMRKTKREPFAHRAHTERCRGAACLSPDCQKACPAESFGGKKSVKGNRQGVLSRSITRRGGRIAKENATIFYFAILEAAWRKRPEGAFLTSWGADSRARRIAADPNRLSIKQGRPKVCHCEEAGGRRGNLVQAITISPTAFPQSGQVLRDCHGRKAPSQ